ncbi:MAG: JAB domain-containing protein [Candidatus Caccovivens sp.]
MRTKTKDDKNVHEGHRQRLVELACNVGVENLTEVQAVELFLFYIFPRGDVNPLAHKLIDKYETLNHIIDADVLDLCQVLGVNNMSAKKISLVRQIFFKYTTSRMGNKAKMTCRGDVLDVVEDFLRFRNTEHILLLALSHANIVTAKRLIVSKDTGSVSLSALELTGFLSSAKPSSLVVAHCHPYGSATPSEEDVRALEMMKTICFNCGVRLIDSYIVGEDGVFGQLEDKLVRYYYDIDQLKEAFGNL